MRKIFFAFCLLIIPTVKSIAQGDPASLFKKLFADIKSGNADDYASHFASKGQFSMLAQASFDIRSVNQDSLENASVVTDTAFRTLIRQKIFGRLIKLADSLKINLAESQYIDCKYEVTRDPKILCVSLTGSIYLKSGQRYFEWTLGEAVLIKGEWRIIDPGIIKNLDDYKFLLDGPSKMSAYGAGFKTKVKITKVTLSPPPPDLNRPVPPPPPPPPHH